MRATKTKITALIGLALLLGACAQMKNMPAAKSNASNMLITDEKCTPPDGWKIPDGSRGLVAASVFMNYAANGAVNVLAKAFQTDKPMTGVDPRMVIAEADRDKKLMAKVKKDFGLSNLGSSIILYLSPRAVPTSEGIVSLKKGELTKLQADMAVGPSVPNAQMITLAKNPSGVYVTQDAKANISATLQAAVAPAAGKAAVDASGVRAIRSFATLVGETPMAVSIPGTPDPADSPYAAGQALKAVSGEPLKFSLAADPNAPAGLAGRFLVIQFQDRATRLTKCACIRADIEKDGEVEVPTSWKDAKGVEQKLPEGILEVTAFRGYLTKSAITDEKGDSADLYAEARAGFLTYAEVKPAPPEEKK
jgi:hypothetical protein